jgi:uroporphyrinogen decarboxylase-like protein
MATPQQELTPDAKREARFAKWKSGEGIEFKTPEARQGYQQRVQRFIDTICMKKADRIPVSPMIGFFQHVYAGITPRDAMYDFEKLAFAVRKFHQDFMPDTLAGTWLVGAGKILEILDYKLYRWPGHGLDPMKPYQAVEGEYMHADEYRQLINDPSDFFLRTYLPRVLGALAPFSTVGSLTDLVEMPSVPAMMIPFGLPAMQETLKRLAEAGTAALEWATACRRIDAETMGTFGISGLSGGIAKAPFDILGDTLRGTRDIMLDKYRKPKEVLAAVERLVPLAIEAGLRSSRNAMSPVILMPLHKGADSFMSRDDFRKFYWPTLKAVILGLINEGVVPSLFAEGAYNKRLDLITDPDIPAGKTIWMFDQTDIREVKKHLGGWACFGGNVPSSMLVAATPAQMSDYVKRLIDDVGRDGGYILSTGAVIDDARPDNMHALIDTGKSYGVFR